MAEQEDIQDISNFFKVRPARPNFSVEEIIQAISKNKIVQIKNIESNIDAIYYCVNWEQAIEIINKFFNEQHSKAKSFFKLQAERMVCDGSIFYITKELAEQAEIENDLDKKLHYLSHFGYLCSGYDIDFIDKTEQLNQRLSKYPIL